MLRGCEVEVALPLPSRAPSAVQRAVLLLLARFAR